MAVEVYSLEKHGDKMLSANFKIREFRCKDGTDEIKVDVDFVREKLQRIREWAGAPIIINSAYRTDAYNKKVGGAPNSYHKRGQAFDIRVQGKSLDDVCKFAQSIGVLGIIKYPRTDLNFVHIDSRTVKYYSNDGGKTSCGSFT